MKKLLYFISAMLIVAQATSQNTFPSSGNVGIGTTTPSVPFQIGTTLNQGDQIFNFGNPQQYNQIIFKDRDFSNFRYGIQSGELKLGTSGNQHKLMSIQWNAHNIELWPTVAINSPSNILINAGQNVGIGKTNPAYKLDVNGTVNATSFLINGNPLPTLSGSGNTFYLPATASLGIGTSNPQYPLDVNGDARISNNLYVGGGVVIADEVHAAHTVTAGTVSADTISTGVIVGGADVIGDITGSNKLTVGGNTELTGSLKVASLAGSGETPLFVDNNGNVFKQVPTPNWSCHPTTLSWHPGGNNFNALNNVFNPPPNDIGTCDDYDFILKANNVRRQWIKPDGKIGFGIQNPGDAFHFSNGNVRIDGTGAHIGSIASTAGYNRALIVNGDVSLANYFPTNATGNPSNGFNGIEILGNDQMPTRRGMSVDADPNGHFNFYIHSFQSNSYFKFINGANSKDLFTVSGNGQVWVGEKKQASGPHTDFAFATDGKIVAKSCYIRVTDWADNVFEKDYKVPNPYEIEKFYIANKRLEGIPSEKEVLENGIEVGEMNKLLLKKMEEMTIIMVNQQKEIDALKAEFRNKHMKD